MVLDVATITQLYFVLLRADRRERVILMLVALSRPTIGLIWYSSSFTTRKLFVRITLVIINTHNNVAAAAATATATTAASPKHELPRIIFPNT